MSGWGKAILNNTIGWGLAAVNNSISFGESQKEENSWSGDTEIYGSSLTPEQAAFIVRVEADGGTVESIECVIV